MAPVSNIVVGVVTVIFKLSPINFSDEITVLKKQFIMVMGVIRKPCFHWCM